MKLAAFLNRVQRTRWDERLVLAEAVTALAIAALAIRLFPFKWLARKAGASGRDRIGNAEGAAGTTEQLRWAIKATVPFLPWKTLCFQQGLALHSMLRRRGIASFLHYGVGQSVERGLTAHVWVSVDGRVLIGEIGAGSHACLATFPTMAERS